jgi:excisionase family DNA binding protein
MSVWGRRARLDLKPRRTYTHKEDENLFIDKKRAAEIVSLNPKTIEREIQRGKLRASKLAGKIRIHCDDLRAWIEANVIEPSVHDV